MAGQIISDGQRELNKKLHQSRNDFGNRFDAAGLAGNLPKTILRMHELGVCNSFLDYGTGKGKLVHHLRENISKNITCDGYDPAVEEWSEHPSISYDIVSCLDVLEHVELTSVEAVIDDIFCLTKNFCYIVIDVQPAVKKLDDGRNAHIMLAPQDWWLQKFNSKFVSVASFPIYHQSNHIQKIVILGCKDVKFTHFMYSFVQKMKLTDLVMGGGILGKKKL